MTCTYTSQVFNAKYICILPEDGDLNRQDLEITVVLHFLYLMNQLLYGMSKVFPAKKE